jgi:hypothetical protein
MKGTPELPERARRLLLSLLEPADWPPPAVAVLVLAAAAVGVAGYLHGRLFHQGYSHVDVVGPLFLLNLIASGVTVVLLLGRRYALFMGSTLGISVGAVVSILISHSSSFFGFAEHRYDGRATTIVVAEIVAAVLVLVAAVLARAQLQGLVAPPRAEVGR